MATITQPTPETVTLTNDEVLRYSRHLIMPEVGMEGQLKLKAANPDVFILNSGSVWQTYVYQGMRNIHWDLPVVMHLGTISVNFEGVVKPEEFPTNVIASAYEINTLRPGDDLDELDRLLACDAQTAGGLLAALPAAAAERLGWPVIGELCDGPAGSVLVD